MDATELTFFTEPTQILQKLQESKISGNIVGISAPLLGTGVFLTAVDDIAQTDSDYLITLKGYDVTGYILERNKLKLSEIRSICAFKSKFLNPYLKELTGERFYEIR